MRLQLSLVLVVCAAVAYLRKRGASCVASRFETLRRLLALMFPCIESVEFFLVGCVTALVASKTMFLLESASSRRGLAKFLVAGKRECFVAAIVDVVLWSVPRAVIDSSVKFFATCLAQRLRSNLQETLHGSLQCSHGYYRCKSIDGLDQRCTSDAMMVSYGFVDTMLQLVGPVFDIAYLSRGVFEVANSSTATAGIATYFVVSLAALRAVPDMSGLLNSLHGRETDLRTTHAQISSHAEEIAFYRGESVERESSNRRLDSVLRKSKELMQAKTYSDVVESIITKYLSTAAGYFVCAEPVLNVADATDRAGRFGFLQQLYTPLAQAVGRVARVNNRSTSLLSSASRASCFLDMRINASQPQIRETPRLTVESVSVGVADCGIILKNISFSLIPGDSLLITGSSGVGKSTLVSVLAGVALPLCGEVMVPHGMVMVSPQRTVLPLGPLRDLLTYPIDKNGRLQLNMSDAEVCAAAQKFGLSTLVGSCGLDAVHNWDDLLSGGERQRVALTRVALHRPTFVVLDDCTNALTQQDEITFLAALQREGIALVTVSHRSALGSIHNNLLNLDDHVAR
jgi:ATP-binding cassette, subfamily D (ALD), member 3